VSEEILPGARETGILLRGLVYGAFTVAVLCLLGVFSWMGASTDELLADIERQASISDQKQANVRFHRATRDSVGRMLTDSLRVVVRSRANVRRAVAAADSAARAITTGKDTAVAGDTARFVQVFRDGDPSAHATPAFVMEGFDKQRLALDSAVRQIKRLDRSLELANQALVIDAMVFDDYDELIASIREEQRLQQLRERKAVKAAWWKGLKVGAVVGGVISAAAAIVVAGVM
jgi:hypothetical protein